MDSSGGSRVCVCDRGDHPAPPWNVDDVTRAMSKGGCLWMSKSRGGSRIFERGGPGADTGFFTSTPPPLGHCPCDVICPQKNGKTPHSWTFTSTPPPLGIARVTSSTFQGGGGRHTHTPWIRQVYKQKRGRSNFGPNVKKPTSWPKPNKRATELG